MIYHLVKKAYWKIFENGDNYFPETFESEGFIHLSKPHQIAGVLNRYFQNENELVLLSFEESNLGEKLIYEPATNGELFPHFYDKISKEIIQKVSFGNSEKILKEVNGS